MACATVQVARVINQAAIRAADAAGCALVLAGLSAVVLTAENDAYRYGLDELLSLGTREAFIVFA